MRLKLPPKPVNYQIRKRKRFAIFPVYLDDNEEWLWLEFYIEQSIYYKGGWYLQKNLDISEETNEVIE